MNCGIYKITNKINNKCYIGSSVNILERFKSHRNKLKSNKHINNYFQNAYNKHGINNFIYIYIRFCYTMMREIYIFMRFGHKDI
jgi:group I intron endonuclease